MENILITILTVLTIVSPILFLIGLIMAIASKDKSKKQLGIKLLIISVISFLIGFGGCLMIVNTSGFH